MVGRPLDRAHDGEGDVTALGHIKGGPFGQECDVMSAVVFPSACCARSYCGSSAHSAEGETRALRQRRDPQVAGGTAALTFLIVTVALWTLGEMTYSPSWAAYVANLAPVHARRRYQGAWGLTAGVGLILAPAIGTQGFNPRLRPGSSLAVPCVVRPVPDRDGGISHSSR